MTTPHEAPKPGTREHFLQVSELQRWGTIQEYVDLCRTHGYFTPARNLAIPTVSRRGVLRAALAGFVFGGGQLAPATGAPLRRFVGVPPVASNCRQRMVGNIVIYETSLERAGVALHQQLSYNRATQVSTVNLTISRGQTLIIKMDATTGGSVNATIN